MKEVDDIIAWMDQNRTIKNVEGMARFGINSSQAFGLPMPMLRSKAKEYRKRHDLALALWETGYHEAQLMAALIDDPKLVTEQQMDEWVSVLDSWDTCDQCCMNLFRHTPFAYDKIVEYAPDEREFVRRTAFVLMATLAVHDKKASDDVFASYMHIIVEHSADPRNFVKKAVNWALRQIGKRNMVLNGIAAEVAQSLAVSQNATARWIGKDAYRELSAAKTIEYIREHRK